MNRRISKILFYTISETFGPPIVDIYNKLKRNEKESYSHIEELQFDKLLSITKYAVGNTNYYKNLFTTYDIDIEKIFDFNDFKKIPTTSKQMLMKSPADVLSQKNIKSLKIAKTSGSSGIPFRFYRDKYAIATTYACMYRGHSWHGAQIGEKEARLWSVPVGFLGAKNLIKDRLLNRFRQNSAFTTDECFRDFYLKMKLLRPSYLMGYPSLLFSFALFCEREGLDCKALSLKFVKYTGEMIFDYQIEVIQKCFDVKCVSEYGSAESGVISFECPSGSHHIMSDTVYVEFINNDKNKNFLPEVFITNLSNYSFPLIRYKLGDLAIPLENFCECGLPFPVMSSVRGRSHNYAFDNNNLKIHSSSFSLINKALIDRFNIRTNIRYVQRKRGEIEVEIYDKKCNIEILEEFFLNYSSKNYNNNLRFTVKLIEKSNDIMTDKFKYFITYL